MPVQTANSISYMSIAIAINTLIMMSVVVRPEGQVSDSSSQGAASYLLYFTITTTAGNRQ